jgi:hypothetical protein
MKRMFDATRLTEFFIKAGLIVALAAALLMPMTVRLHGNEVSSDVPRPLPMLSHAAWEILPLPPIPYLESMPWLMQQRGERGFKIDMLLAPKFELLGPAVARPRDINAPVAGSTFAPDIPHNG